MSPRRPSVFKPPRCHTCDQPITFFTSPSGRLRPYDPTPVPDPRGYSGPPAYPVEGRRAWRFPDLVEDLQVRRHCSTEVAEAEAYDMAWHTPHRCPATTPDTEPGRTA